MADFGHPSGGMGHHGAGAGAGGPIFNDGGAIMSQAERVRYCERRGLCTTCGEVKTHKFTGVLRRRTPLNNVNVKNGACLVCNPHLREGGVSTLIGSASVAVAGASSPPLSRPNSSGQNRSGPLPSALPSPEVMNAQQNWERLGTATGALGAMGALSSLSSVESSSRGGRSQQELRRPLSSTPSHETPQTTSGRSHHTPTSISSMSDSSGRGGRSERSAGSAALNLDRSGGRTERPPSSAGGMSDSAGSSSAHQPQQDDLDEKYGWVPPRKRGGSSSRGLARPVSLSNRSISTGTPKDEWDVVKSMREFPNDLALLSRQMHRLRAIGKNQASAVYEVIAVMKRHPRDGRLQAAACGAVWGIAASDDDVKIEAVSAGAVEAIVGAMKSSPGDARLAMWGVGAIACLAAGTGNRDTVVEHGASDAIVSALMAHPREPAVFEWAARALHSLVEEYAGDVKDRDEAELREERANTLSIVRGLRSSPRLLPGLIRAMQFHPSAFVAQEWSFRFLWVLLTTGDGDANADNSNWKEVEPASSLLRSISDEGGLKVCMDVIRARPTTERLQEMAFALLCSAADQTSWIGSGNTDRIESIIELMMEYPHNAWIQEEACALLSVWVAAEDDRRTILPGMGGLKAVLAAMENHPSSATLHESACHILWTLSSSSSLWRGDAPLLQRVAKSLVASLTRHADSAVVQGRALGALSNLLLFDGAHSPGGEKDEALLVDAVVSVLLSNSSDPDLVERGSRVLANACHADPFGRTAGAIVDSGGVRAVARGMAACPGYAAAQEAGLEALCGALSSSQDEHRAAVIESGGVEAIRDAMTGGGGGPPPSMAALLRGTYAICMVTLCKRSDQSVVREGVVDAIVGAMDGPHGDSNDLLTRCCLALRNFSLAAVNTGRTRREAAVPNPGEAMGAVLRILQRKGELNVQKEACGALFALSALCSDTVSIPLDAVFREMIRILEHNKGDDLRPFNGCILGEALGALENLSGLAVQEGGGSSNASGGLGLSIRLDLQDIDIIIAVMYEALGQETPQPDVVDGVFGVLLNLSNELVYEDAIIQCGGIVSIIDAMQENEGNEPIESKGCAILARLSADNLEVKLCIAETDGVEVIISAMLHNPMLASTQVQACRTLAHLTIDEETRTLITQQGGIVLILQAMTNHPDDADLQETACEALCGLACDAHESVLSESNVVGAVVDTMRAHVDAPRVQERALGILQNLSMRSPSSKMAVASAGGIEEIVAAIRENMTSSEVLERAFTALWSLAVLDGNQDRIIATDGISIIINAMMASIGFLAVQKQACGCLCTLSSNPKCKRLIKDNGGLDAIVFAMWAHLNSESLLVEACRALSSLAVMSNDLDGPDEANEGVVDAVILCMRRFPDSVKLQEIVCLALRNLSLSPSMLRLMKQRTDDLEKLLHKAAAKFPGECSQRANQVLTQLFD